VHDDQAHRTPHLYNLYPRLAGTMTTWPGHVDRAAHMGFDWIYLNPWHYPGFSGSCYAVKDHGRVDPLLLPEGHPDKHYEEHVRTDGGIGALGDAVQAMRARGLHPIMDLVLNHTARDSHLVRQHPDWYVRDPRGEILSPWAIDPADARKVTVWGDLAEIDNAASPDRDGLWGYWIRLVEQAVRLGFDGFRCDAAYKVPAELWCELIAAAERERPGIRFFGETLGARLEEIEALRDSGIHYNFNSSKWWNFDEAWCLDQQRTQPGWIHSVSFPESHDTPRLWGESGGRTEVQKQRYAFAAGFASGLMMPIGYEYGFQHRIDVVSTQAQNWETAHVDLTSFVARVNAVRREHPALTCETTEALTPLDTATLVLEKRGNPSLAHLVVNKDWHQQQTVDLPDAVRGRRVLRVCRDASPRDEVSGTQLVLDPAEVVYVV
jgi:starch synthase (maltosyl-transferring)